VTLEEKLFDCMALDLSGSQYRPLIRSCGHGNRPLGSLKDKGFYQAYPLFLKKKSVLWR